MFDKETVSPGTMAGGNDEFLITKMDAPGLCHPDEGDVSFCGCAMH